MIKIPDKITLLIDDLLKIRLIFKIKYDMDIMQTMTALKLCDRIMPLAPRTIKNTEPFCLFTKLYNPLTKLV